MNNICPNCEKVTKIEHIDRIETIAVRNEPIEVKAKYYRCHECGEEFENTRDEHDALELAYREYRRQHGMLQPEDIHSWRKAYDLTQRETSELLGWGGATLSRYENGALQSEAQDKVLRLAMNPFNLRRMLNEHAAIFSKEKYKRLLRKLDSPEKGGCSPEQLYEQYYGHYEPDEFSGFQNLNLSKLTQAILFFCRGGGQLKTKINKLLFYADFKHFKEYSRSITGARYVPLPYGPVPDKSAQYLGMLVDEGELEVEEIPYTDEIVGEKYKPTRKPDLSVFSDSELKVITEVKDFFNKYNSKGITDFSHKEKGYLETQNGDFISYYKYAKDLRI